MPDHTITVRDVADTCGLTDHATRKLFADPALNNYTERSGPRAGRPRRYWTLGAVLTVIRQQPWFRPEHGTTLANLDLTRRKENEHV